MTAQQKKVILVLVAVNGLVLVLGCIGLVLFLTMSSGAPQQQAAAATATPSSRPTGPTATATKPAPTPTVESGWVVHSVPKHGYAIAYPKSWKFQDLDTSDISTLISSLKKTDPQMASLVESQKDNLSSGGLNYLAMDTGAGSTTGGLSTTSNMIHSTQKQTLTLDMIEAALPAEFDKVPNIIKPVKYRRIDLPAGGQAVEARYVLTMGTATKQPVKIATIQYVYVHNKEMYTLTFSIPPTLESKYLPTVEKIAKTLRYIQP